MSQVSGARVWCQGVISEIKVQDSEMSIAPSLEIWGQLPNLIFKFINPIFGSFRNLFHRNPVLGFRTDLEVQGSWFGAQGSGSRVWGLGLKRIRV